MEKEYIRSLIILIGGSKLEGETIQRYLARVSLYSGVPYRSVKAAYYGQNIGPNTFISSINKEKFEQAAQHVRRPDALIAYIKLHVTVWEGDPARHRAWIDASRRLLDELHQPTEALRGSDQLARHSDVGGRERAGGTTSAAESGLSAAAHSAAKA